MEGKDSRPCFRLSYVISHDEREYAGYGKGRDRGWTEPGEEGWEESGRLFVLRNKRVDGIQWGRRTWAESAKSQGRAYLSRESVGAAAFAPHLASLAT